MCFTYLIKYAPVLKDLVLTLAALVGACVAVKGLNTWDRQLKGSVEYDLARRLLKSTYRMRETIKGVRNPLMWNYELPEPPQDKAKEMKYDEVRQYGLEKAYQNRWDKVNEVRVDLQADLLEAEAIWSRDVYDRFDSLFSLQTELFRYIQNYITASNPNTGEGTREAIQKTLHEKRDVMYDLGEHSTEPDAFKSDLSKAIAEIENYLKPHLKK